jgi:hypothetical protein
LARVQRRMLARHEVNASSAPAKPSTASTSALTSKKSTVSRPCAQPSGRRLPQTTPRALALASSLPA